MPVDNNSIIEQFRQVAINSGYTNDQLKDPEVFRTYMNDGSNRRRFYNALTHDPDLQKYSFPKWDDFNNQFNSDLSSGIFEKDNTNPKEFIAPKDRQQTESKNVAESAPQAPQEPNETPKVELPKPTIPTKRSAEDESLAKEMRGYLDNAVNGKTNSTALDQFVRAHNVDMSDLDKDGQPLYVGKARTASIDMMSDVADSLAEKILNQIGRVPTDKVNEAITNAVDSNIDEIGKVASATGWANGGDGDPYASAYSNFVNNYLAPAIERRAPGHFNGLDVKLNNLGDFWRGRRNRYNLVGKEVADSAMKSVFDKIEGSIDQMNKGKVRDWGLLGKAAQYRNENITPEMIWKQWTSDGTASDIENSFMYMDKNGNFQPTAAVREGMKKTGLDANEFLGKYVIPQLKQRLGEYFGERMSSRYAPKDFGDYLVDKLLTDTFAGNAFNAVATAGQSGQNQAYNYRAQEAQKADLGLGSKYNASTGAQIGAGTITMGVDMLPITKVTKGVQKGVKALGKLGIVGDALDGSAVGRILTPAQQALASNVQAISSAVGMGAYGFANTTLQAINSGESGWDAVKTGLQSFAPNAAMGLFFHGLGKSREAFFGDMRKATAWKPNATLGEKAKKIAQRIGIGGLETLHDIVGFSGYNATEALINNQSIKPVDQIKSWLPMKLGEIASVGGVKKAINDFRNLTKGSVVGPVHFTEDEQREVLNSIGKKDFKDITDKDILNVVKDTKNVSWSARNKIGLIYGGFEAHKPRTYKNVQVGNMDKGYIDEKDQNGDLIQRHYYNNSETRSKIEENITNERQSYDLDNEIGYYFAKVASTKARTGMFSDIVDQVAEQFGFKGDGSEKDEKIVKRIETPGTDEYNTYVQEAFKRAAHQAALDKGVSDSMILDVIGKDPREWTVTDRELIQSVTKALNQTFQNSGELDTPHETVSGAQTADEVGAGTENENPQAVSQASTEISQAVESAKQAWNDFSKTAEGEEVAGQMQQFIRQGVDPMSDQMYNLLSNYFNEERLAPLANLINAQTRQKAFLDKTAQNINEQASRVAQNVVFQGTAKIDNTDFKDGVIYVTDGKDNYVLTSGDVVIDKEGKIRAAEGGAETVTLRRVDENGILVDGEGIYIRHPEDFTYKSSESVDDLTNRIKQQVGTNTTANIAAGAQGVTPAEDTTQPEGQPEGEKPTTPPTEGQPEGKQPSEGKEENTNPQFKVGDQVEYNGNTYTVKSIDKDGNYEIERQDGTSTVSSVARPDQLKPVTENSGEGPLTPPTDNGTPPPAPIIGGEGEKPKDNIPRDKHGNGLYHQMEPTKENLDAAIEDIKKRPDLSGLGRKGNNDPNAFADRKIKQAEKELADLEKKNKDAIDEFQNGEPSDETIDEASEFLTRQKDGTLSEFKPKTKYGKYLLASADATARRDFYNQLKNRILTRSTEETVENINQTIQDWGNKSAEIQRGLADGTYTKEDANKAQAERKAYINKVQQQYDEMPEGDAKKDFGNRLEALKNLDSAMTEMESKIKTKPVFKFKEGDLVKDSDGSVYKITGLNEDGTYKVEDREGKSSDVDGKKFEKFIAPKVDFKSGDSIKDKDGNIYTFIKDNGDGTVQLKDKDGNVMNMDVNGLTKYVAPKPTYDWQSLSEKKLDNTIIQEAEQNWTKAEELLKSNPGMTRAELQRSMSIGYNQAGLFMKRWQKEKPTESKAAEKFNKAEKIKVEDGKIYMPDGTEIEGTYYIVPAMSLTPSHDPFNDYKTSEGFPTNEDGSNVNDRDYEHNKTNQKITNDMASDYNGQAVQDVPVVSDEGIVYSGNGRTMAGQLAAKHGTDSKYLTALKDKVKDKVLSEDIDKIQNARLIFVPKKRLPYTTDIFFKFNAPTQKPKTNLEKAKAIGKSLSDDDKDIIAEQLAKAKNINTFFDSTELVKGLLDKLVNMKALTQNEATGMTDDKGHITEEGEKTVTNILLATAFDSDTIDKIFDKPAIKRKLIQGMKPILENRKLGEYSLDKYINEAVDLIRQAYATEDNGKRLYKSVDAFLRTGSFDGGWNKDHFSTMAKELALRLDGKVDDFRSFIDGYNKNARPYTSKEGELFDAKPKPEDLVKQYLDSKNPFKVVYNKLVDKMKMAGMKIHSTKEEGQKKLNAAESDGESDLKFSLRRKPAPKKTQKVYKLMRLGADGKLYPLFIDSAEGIEVGKWYDADSPDMSVMKKLDSGIWLIDPKSGTATSLKDYNKAHHRLGGKYPTKEAINEAANNGQRWVVIKDTKAKQARYDGEKRTYYNIGINGAGGVTEYAMRPGWHAGSLPTMRQIGKGTNRDLRDNSFVWIEGEVPADKDYNAEAQNNPMNDIPDHIPTDGYYLKSTNANSKAAQADRMGWYVAGAFKADRIISDAEARKVIDDWNTTHQEKKVEYDWKRESGEDFDGNAEEYAKKLYQKQNKAQTIVDLANNFMRVFHGSGADFDKFDTKHHMGEGEGSQVFGAGTYVADQKDLAKQYAEIAFNEKHVTLAVVDGKPFDYNNPRQAEPYVFIACDGVAKWGKEEALKAIKQNIKDCEQLGWSEQKTNYQKAYDYLKAHNIDIPDHNQRMIYEVNIPKDNGSNYLDWDGKLTKEQADKIKKELYKYILKYDTEGAFDSKQAVDELKKDIDVIKEGDTFSDVYGTISLYLSTDRAASKFLNKIGYTGIKVHAAHNSGDERYKQNWNYVVFNDNDLHIANKYKFFRTSKGEVYGFVDMKSGEMYLDPDHMDINVPIHEYGHLWLDGIRRSDKKTYDNIMKLLDENDKELKPFFDEVKKDEPDLEGEDLKEEVLMRYSGKRGEDKLNQKIREIQASDKSAEVKSIAEQAVEKVRTAVHDFWKKVANALGIQYKNVSEVADHMLGDLLEGKNPNLKKAAEEPKKDWSKDPVVSEILKKASEFSKADKAWRDSINNGKNKEEKEAWVARYKAEKELQNAIKKMPSDRFQEGWRPSDDNTSPEDWSDYIDESAADVFNKVYDNYELKKHQEEWFDNRKKTQEEITPVTPSEPSKKKVSPTDFIADKKSNSRDSMKGVFMSKGFVVGSDGRVLFAAKMPYDKKLEGKVVDKKGNTIEDSYPNWQAVIPDEKRTMPLKTDIDGLQKFVEGAIKQKGFEYVIFRDGNGNVVRFGLKDLQKFLKAAKQLGAEVRILDDVPNMLVASNEKGSVLATPVILENEEDFRNSYVYEPKTTHEPPKVEENPLTKLSEEEENTFTAEQKKSFAAEYKKAFDRVGRMNKSNLDQQIRNGRDMLRYTTNKAERLRAEHLLKIFDNEKKQRADFAKKYGIKNGETTIDNVRKMFDEWNGDKELSKVFDRVEKVSKLFGNKIKFTYSLKNSMGNAGTEGLIKYNLSDFTASGYTNQEKAGCLLHELGHHATMYAMLAYEYRNDTRRDSHGLSGQDIWNKLTDGQKTAVENIFNIYHEIKNDKKDFPGGYNSRGNWIGEGKGKQYGLSNAYEMVAEMIGSTEFRAMAKAKNLWTKLKDAIKSFFTSDTKGATETNVKEAVWKEIDYLLEHPNVEAYDAIKNHFYKRKGLRQNLASETQDVSPEDQIFLYGEDKKSSEDTAMMRVDPSGKMSDDAAKHEGEPRQKVLNSIAELSDKLNPNKKVVSVDYDTKRMPKNVRESVERGENVTGWFDPTDGSAHLYMPNIHDSYTAERTILHEVVGHKGLRELLGDKGYATFMRKLYIDNVGGVADYVKENSYKYGYDLYKTIDEYLAEQAEKFGGKDRNKIQRAWDKVRDLFNQALRSVGFNTKFTTRDVKRVLWESKNRINEADPEDSIKRNAFLRKLGLEKVSAVTFEGKNYDESIKRDKEGYLSASAMMKMADEHIQPDDTPSEMLAKDWYRHMLNRTSYVWEEAHVDNMAALKYLMQALGAKDVDNVAGFENPYNLQNQASSVLKIQAENFKKEIFDPLDKAVSEVLPNFGDKNKERLRNFQIYMVKKSGLERNRVFFVRDWLKNERTRINHVKAENLPKFAQAKLTSKQMDAVETRIANSRVDLENKKITQKQFDNLWNQAVIAVYNEGLDSVENGFKAVRQENKKKLDNGEIRFDEYLKNIDDWINQKIDLYEPGENDFSGFREMQGKEKNESYDDAQIVSEVMADEAKMEETKKGSVKDFWDKVKKVSQFSLDTEYNAGLYTKETYDRVSDMMNWYVPLRGFDRDTAEDHNDYFDEKSTKDFIGPTLMKAKGRYTQADLNSPLAALGSQATASLQRAMQNKIKQAFGRFIDNRYSKDGDNRLVTKSDTWIVKHQVGDKEEWVESFPPIDENTKEKDIPKIIEDWENRMKELESQNLALKSQSKGAIGLIFKRADHRDQHIVTVYNNGKKVQYIVNGNPRAAQAVNGQLTDSQVNSKIKFILNGMQQLFTSYSPDFIMSNGARDFIQGTTTILEKESPKYAWNFFVNYLKSVGRLLPGSIIRSAKIGNENGLNVFERYKHDRLKMDNPTDRLFKEFADNGGMTGFWHAQGVDDWKDYVQDQMNNLRAGKAIKIAKGLNPLTTIKNLVEDMNERVENLTRFAVYRTSREMGRSITKSIADAKEVSTNFNRKGSGDAVKNFYGNKATKGQKFNQWAAGTSAHYLKNYTMFYNAGVQSLRLLAKNMKNSPFKTAGIQVAGQFLLGALGIPALNRWLQSILDDDTIKEGDGESGSYIDDNGNVITKDVAPDWYAELPDWVRRQNICIYAGHGHFITIPNSIESRAFFGMGDLAASFFGDISSNKVGNTDLNNPNEDKVMSVFGMLSQMLPTDWVGAEKGSGLLTAFLPSILTPWAEVMQNKDWLGRPIKQDRGFGNEYAPNWMLANSNTSGALVSISKYMEKKMSGYDNPEIRSESKIFEGFNDPSAWQHLLEGYSGGFGTTITNMVAIWNQAKEEPADASTISKATDLLTSRNMPIFRRLNRKDPYGATRQKYYQYYDIYSEAKHKVDVLRKGGETDPISKMEEVSAEQGRQGKIIEVFERYSSYIKDLSKKIRESQDPQQRKILTDQRDQLMFTAVKDLDQVK